MTVQARASTVWPIRPGLAALPLLSLVALTVAGCVSVTRFLIPPEAPKPRAQTAAQASQRTADAVFLVGAVHGTTDRALAIRGNVVHVVGTPADVTPLRTADTVVVKAPTGYLTLGLVDAHVHIEGAAMLRDAADLRGVDSAPSLFKAIEKARPLADQWLWGFGLTQAQWARLSQDQVDTACGDLPCYLSRDDGHGARISSGLAAWMSEDMQDLFRAQAGKLEGELARRVWRALPATRPERLSPLVRQVLDDLQQGGVVEVHAMGESMALVHVLRQLDREGRLPVRIKVFIDADRPEAGLLLEGADKGKASAKVQIAGLKLWLDGTLGAHTAALQLPYADTASSGELRYADSELRERIRDADAAGLQVAVHAIGDRAVAQVARVVRSLNRSSKAAPVRIEHAQIVPPEVREMLWGLPVECSVQPRHALQDAPFAKIRLGAERLAWAYPALALVPVCPVRAGSDFPIAASDPLADWRLMAATNPVELGAEATAGTVREKALAALTSAGSARHDAVIRIGDVADLVLWDKDPFAQGSQARPLYVVVGGALQQVIAR
ncbi:MAG: hypothetical protein EXR77_19870 [Myxococcales bacterium]|nr:hypothetical protein [Myxococcales bacterium]